MRRPAVAKREVELPESTIGRMIKIAEEAKKEYISLGPGEPDFPAPANVVKATEQALEQNQTHYSPIEGRSDLRHAVLKKLAKDNGLKAGMDNVLITTGSTEGIFLSLLAAMDAGEGVMIPDPGFLAYRPAIELLNGMPLPYLLEPGNRFQITTETLEETVVPEKTRAIIVNTPSNPTGMVMRKQALEELADFAVEYDLLIISDEAYEKFVYNGQKHVSIGSLNGMGDRVLSLFTFSKTYAMPGYRLGYATGPKDIISAMAKIHVFTTISAPTFSQIAGIEALEHAQPDVEKMLQEYGRRRQYIFRRLNEIPGFRCIEPDGAFYAFPNIGAFHMKSADFADWLLRKAKVAVIPGTEFGRHGEGFVRMSYASGMDVIERAMDKIEAAVGKIKVKA